MKFWFAAHLVQFTIGVGLLVLIFTIGLFMALIDWVKSKRRK